MRIINFRLWPQICPIAAFLFRKKYEMATVIACLTVCAQSKNPTDIDGEVRMPVGDNLGLDGGRLHLVLQTLLSLSCKQTQT